MRAQVRPSRDEDYPRFVEIANLIDPDAGASDTVIRYHDQAWDRSRHELVRVAVEDADGRVVGFGQINHAPDQFHPRKYWMDIRVDPACQRSGIGNAIYGYLLGELHAREAIVVRTETKESRGESVTFLVRRGFVAVQRRWELRLDVPAFDFAPFAGAAERVAAMGITLTTLAAERQRDTSALRKAYEVCREC